MNTQCLNTAELSPQNRTRAGNGWIGIEGVSAKSWAGRRFRELYVDISSDLPQPLTAADVLAVRHAASAVVTLESLTARLVCGEDVPADQLTRMQNAAARALSALRQRHTAKHTRRGNGSNALADYLAKKNAKVGPFAAEKQGGG